MTGSRPSVSLETGSSGGSSAGASSAGAIGVFDSGLGGLTVLRALLDLLPGEEVDYVGDTARFPYGPKPPAEVRAHALEIGHWLVDRGAKAMVVACNSATAAALSDLRERFEIPVVGVIEPGLRAAASVTASRRVGVIGTVGTIASGAYQRAAAGIALEPVAPVQKKPVQPGGGVGSTTSERPLALTCAACPGFVEFVESGDVDSDQVYVLVERMLAPVREAEVDTLVLGCTHYPLLARTIGDVMGREVVLVSSADETAFEVRRLLTERGLHQDPDSEDRTGPGAASSDRARFFTSGDIDTFRALGERFLGPEVAIVEPVPWGA